MEHLKPTRLARRSLALVLKSCLIVGQGRAYGAPRQPSTRPGARGVLLHPPVFVQLRDLHEHLRFVFKHIGCYLEVNALPSLGVLKAFVAE